MHEIVKKFKYAVCYLGICFTVDGLVSVNEIDPLNRHMFDKSAITKKGSVNYRYSSFEVRCIER